MNKKSRMGKSSTAQQPMWPWNMKKDSAATAPSIHGIVKAGDNHEYSSSLFTQLSDSYVGPSWRPLFEAFSETTTHKPFSPQVAYSKSFSKSAFGSRRRSKSRKVDSSDLSAERRTSFPRKRSRSRDRQSISFRPLKPFDVATLNKVPVVNPSDDLRDIILLDSRPCIPVNPEELVALSFVLGIPLSFTCSILTDEKCTFGINGDGAFGLSLRSDPSTSDVVQIHFRHSTSQAIQKPAPGGSYSTLFAKHIACSSLPFASDYYNTHAFFIDAAILANLKTGQSIVGSPTPLSGRQPTYLSKLPSTSATSFHCLDLQPKPHPHRLPHRSKSVITSFNSGTSTPLARTTRRSWSTRRTDDPSTRRVSWPTFPRRAVSESISPATSSSPSSTTTIPLTFPALISTLPFTGGLPPFASVPLLQAIRFTASGGRKLGNLLSLLENLIHKISRQLGTTVDFGPYLSAQNQADWLQTAGYIDYSPNAETTDVATGVGRVSRYVAAIFALVEMAMSEADGIDIAEKEKEIEEACKAEMENAYWDAVQSGFRTDEEKKREKETLGSVLAEVLKKPLPFDVSTIATVARLVVAAWTWQVGVVVWSGEEREEVRRWKGARGVYEAIEFEKMPRSMVLA